MATLNNKSALGNYVHYEYKNYLNKGIENKKGSFDSTNQDPPGLLEAYGAAHELWTNRLKEIEMSLDLTKIEKNINNFLGTKSNNQGFFQSEEQGVKLINDILTMFMTKSAIDATDKKTDDSKEEQQKFNQYATNLKIYQSDVSQGEKIRKCIKSILTYVNSKQDLTVRRLKNLNTRIQELQQYCNNILQAQREISGVEGKKDNQANIYLNGRLNEFLTMYKDKKKELLEIVNNKDSTKTNFWTEISDFLMVVQVITTLQQFQGNFGEYSTALAQQGKDLAMGAVVKTLLETVKGQDRASFSYGDEDVVGLSGFTSGMTQNKIDVQYTITDNINGKEVSPRINASVKNYQNWSSIHLQEVGVLPLLLFLEKNACRFGTHFLNLMGTNENNNSYIKQYLLVKNFIAYSALAKGNLLKDIQETANVFIIFDTLNKNSQVKVLSIHQILNNIDEYIKMTNLFSSNDSEPLQKYLRDNNQFYEEKTPEQRITDLISCIHTMTIGVTMNVKKI